MIDYANEMSSRQYKEKGICPRCKGSGKEEITFDYDNSDKKTSCYNMLKQIDKVSNGCDCSECGGEGKIDLSLWAYEQNEIIEHKKILLNRLIYNDGTVLIKSLPYICS